MAPLIQNTIPAYKYGVKIRMKEEQIYCKRQTYSPKAIKTELDLLNKYMSMQAPKGNFQSITDLTVWRPSQPFKSVKIIILHMVQPKRYNWLDKDKIFSLIQFSENSF